MAIRYGISKEGGSSGSPLFNSNHKIIGQLRGGAADCSALNAPIGMANLVLLGIMVPLLQHV